MKTRRGFTLVEMLTVIVIILILAGITMKLMALVNQKTARARAAGDIERIKNALDGYYAKNGCYPPAGRLDSQFKAPPPYEMLAPPAAPKNGYKYYDGMMTYLFPDGANTEPWAKFVDGWAWKQNKEYGAYADNNALYGNMSWSNAWHTIRDPWNQIYVYSSGPPYQAYILLSPGPDGDLSTPGDNIGDKWLE